MMARDLSIDGLFVESGRPYPAGTRLECCLDLNRKPVQVTTQVRHQSNQYHTEDGVGPYKGMGLQFVRLGADELVTVRAYLTRLTCRNSEG